MGVAFGFLKRWKSNCSSRAQLFFYLWEMGLEILSEEMGLDILSTKHSFYSKWTFYAVRVTIDMDNTMRAQYRQTHTYTQHTQNGKTHTHTHKNLCPNAQIHKR